MACGGKAGGKGEGGGNKRRGEREHRERRTDTTADEENWARVVELVHMAFRDRDLAEEATWKAVVLIPKGKGDYRGIGLVEVMWKGVAVVLNRRFTSSITFHDVLHGFRAGTWTCPKRTTLWTGLGAWISWRDTASASAPGGY